MFFFQKIIKKKNTEKNKLPALKLNQFLAKWNFSDDRKFFFKNKREKFTLTLKFLFQNFLPWLYHMNSKMLTCKLRRTFIKNVLYFSKVNISLLHNIVCQWRETYGNVLRLFKSVAFTKYMIKFSCFQFAFF